jgi:hypothetical protein
MKYTRIPLKVRGIKRGKVRWNEGMKLFVLLTISCFPPEPPFITIAPTPAVLNPTPFNPDPDTPGADEGIGGCPEKAASSLGTISIRKSK